MKKIELGAKVKDKISGLEGIATARIEYLNGCIQYAISPPVDKDGNIRKDWWIDEQQLEELEPKEETVTQLTNKKKEKPGGGFRSHPH